MTKHEHEYGPVTVQPVESGDREVCDKCGCQIPPEQTVTSRCRICGKREQ